MVPVFMHSFHLPSAVYSPLTTADSSSYRYSSLESHSLVETPVVVQRSALVDTGFLALAASSSRQGIAQKVIIGKHVVCYNAIFARL